jgi:N-acetylglucosamine-6-phosphate deacetylase
VLLTNAVVVTDGTVWDRGWVHLDGDRIDDAGRGERTGGTDLEGSFLVPGFVDLHAHGGGGASFHGGTGEARVATSTHLRHGTTTMLGGLASRSLEDMAASAQALVPLVPEGLLSGIFYEGPFLSPARCGVHSPAVLRRPSLGELDSLLAAGGGAVRMTTIAPELPDALDLVQRLVASGCVAAVGHTDASYEECVAAFDAGARVATHLFNAMRPLHHRDPGPVAAALGDERIVCELIADGHHLHPATLRLAFETAGPSRVALVTDATEGAGGADGDYRHGDVVVRVGDGRAVVAGTETLAGSTLTMDGAVRHAVAAGVTVADAIVAATSTPARVLGLEDHVGSIRAGARADLVVLDRPLGVRRVMRGGTWLD